jgi:hypothetical protein
LLSLIALVLIVGPGRATDADAGIRVDATLRTPNTRVHISNTSSQHFQSYFAKNHRIRTYRHYRIGEQDRKMARRLAWYTGVPARELIYLKRRGYRWFEIGRWLHVPRPVVRAAMSDRSWRRFVRAERRHAKFGDERHRWRRVEYSVDDEYDDD